jgi:hypothetical protein
MEHGKHISAELRTKIQALVGEGKTLTAISAETGVSVNSIGKIRKKMNLVKPVKVASDPVDLRRALDENTRLKRDLAETARRAAASEDIRALAFKLAAPLEPSAVQRPVAADPRAETIIVMASDWHWGEVIRSEAMDGLNSYNSDIASARAARFFSTVSELATQHWAGPKPARIILILNGDMLSGEIHEELAKSNSELAVPAAQSCASAIIGGLSHWLETLECAIEVLSLPGNHGRTTRKPESKFVDVSMDLMIANMVEMYFSARGEKRITFKTPVSGDALFSVDGWVFLATHGDRIGSRGGQGVGGPAMTVARGFKRLVADYAARGTLIDTILIGHFHVPLRLEEGYVCGTLAGPSEYARDGRFRPHPASQLFLTVHPKRGVTQVREIRVGAPEEGSIYDGRTDHGVLRPRYRVKAISVPS